MRPSAGPGGRERAAAARPAAAPLRVWAVRGGCSLLGACGRTLKRAGGERRTRRGCTSMPGHPKHGGITSGRGGARRARRRRSACAHAPRQLPGRLPPALASPASVCACADQLPSVCGRGRPVLSWRRVGRRAACAAAGGAAAPVRPGREQPAGGTRSVDRPVSGCGCGCGWSAQACSLPGCAPPQGRLPCTRSAATALRVLCLGAVMRALQQGACSSMPVRCGVGCGVPGRARVPGRAFWVV